MDTLDIKSNINPKNKNKSNSGFDIVINGKECNKFFIKIGSNNTLKKRRYEIGNDGGAGI